MGRRYFNRCNGKSYYSIEKDSFSRKVFPLILKKERENKLNTYSEREKIDFIEIKGSEEDGKYIIYTSVSDVLSGKNRFKEYASLIFGDEKKDNIVIGVFHCNGDFHVFPFLVDGKKMKYSCYSLSHELLYKEGIKKLERGILLFLYDENHSLVKIYYDTSYIFYILRENDIQSLIINNINENVVALNIVNVEYADYLDPINKGDIEYSNIDRSYIFDLEDFIPNGNLQPIKIKFWTDEYYHIYHYPEIIKKLTAQRLVNLWAIDFSKITERKSLMSTIHYILSSDGSVIMYILIDNETACLWSTQQCAKINISLSDRDPCICGVAYNLDDGSIFYKKLYPITLNDSGKIYFDKNSLILRENESPLSRVMYNFTKDIKKALNMKIRIFSRRKKKYSSFVLKNIILSS